MVVILAGCDGTGKSTCFSELRKTFDANFIKESYTADVEKKRLRALFTASKATDDDLTIYDRATLLDDLVYDPVMVNEESKLLSILNKKIISDALNNCLIIYFDLDDFELTKRIESRGDDYITIHQINKIKYSYEKTFEEFNINFKRVDVTGLSKDCVCNIVKGIIIDEEFKNSSDSTC